MSTGRKKLSGRVVTLDLSEERSDLKQKETSVQSKSCNHLLEGGKAQCAVTQKKGIISVTLTDQL